MTGSTQETMSPLALYRKAYDLHYKDGDLSTACDMYEQIIKQFPNSDVCAYAAIQLQKIQASDVALKMARGNSRTLPLLLMLIVNIILLVGVGIFAAYHVHQIGIERRKYSMLSRAVAKMAAGKDDEALDLLREIKIGFRNDITPFAVSAEIYRLNHDYLRARKEYETYRRLYPQDPVPEMEIAILNEEEDVHIKKTMKADRTEMPEDVGKEADRKAAARAKASKRRSRTTRPVSKKPKLLIPPDSITYF